MQLRRCVFLAIMALLAAGCVATPSTEIRMQASDPRPNPWPKYGDVIQYRWLSNMDAEEAAALAYEVFGLTTAANRRKQIVVLRGHADLVENGMRMLDRADEMAIAGARRVIIVKHLEHAKADQLTATLNAMASAGFFQVDGKRLEPVFAADLRTQSIVASADPRAKDDIERIMDALDWQVKER